MILTLTPFTLWFFPCAAGDDADGRARRRPIGADDARPSAAATIAEDASVAAAIRAGDETAFDRLFRGYHVRLVRFAAAMLGSDDVADDVVAEVFQRIWSRRQVWAPEGSIERYLFLAVRNQVRNVVRDTRRAESRVRGLSETGQMPGAGVAPVAPDVPVQLDDLRTHVWALIDAMPEARRVAAHLRWQDGMEYAEIAKILGTSSAAVQMQLSRALSALRALIGG